MKSGLARTLLAFAMAQSAIEGSTSKPMVFRPSPVMHFPRWRTRPTFFGDPAPSYFKRKNQRQRRKAARARHAAGFKNSF
jgi:hypothetical protein